MTVRSKTHSPLRDPEGFFLDFARKRDVTLIVRGQDHKRFIMMPVNAYGDAREEPDCRLAVDIPAQAVHLHMPWDADFLKALKYLKVPYTISSDEPPSRDIWRPAQRFTPVADHQLKKFDLARTVASAGDTGETGLFAPEPRSNLDRDISISLDDAVKHLETAFRLMEEGVPTGRGGRSGVSRTGQSWSR